MRAELKTSSLRQLDFDDLIVMDLLVRGFTGKEISKHLGLTPPAVSHRFAKLATVFSDEGKFFDRVGNRRVPSPFGQEICEKGQKALNVFLS